MEKSLRSSEWTLVGSFLLLFASLAFISSVQKERDTAHVVSVPAQEKIAITISGEVSKPGTYWVLPGGKLGSILKKSRPKRFADLRALDLEKRVEEPLEICLKELQEITVYVRGAVVEPRELLLAPGTRVCDLKSQVLVSPDADLSFFKKRRLLRDGEIVEVNKKRD